MAKYCPQDRMECGTDACQIDERGRCKRCGKPPVDMADRDRQWLWCDVHDQWHDTPCQDNPSRHCCHPAAA